jgi:UDPglucose 6-dehydrogenase
VTQLAVVGAGYVGLVTAACLAEFGHRVTCIEVDETKLIALGAGNLPIHEPGLAELVWEHVRDGRLQFAGDYPRITDADFVFIAVPTPSQEDGSADTSYVLQAVHSLIPHAKPGLVIVIKSTVPIGTADMIAGLAPVVGAGIEVVSNPEFLRQGTAVQDFLAPDRVVIGASSLQAAVDVARLYGSLDAPVVAVDRRSSELAKYTANALLATRISFMNEISHIATALDADVDDVARIVGMDRRIGPAFLRAGLGWGGSCFPKDVLALSSVAANNGCHTPILQAVYETNELQRERASGLLLRAVRAAQDPVVAILGLAFKPSTDDVRGSPALGIAQLLLKEGVTVRAHDPFALVNASRVLPDIDYRTDPYSALEGADALLLATEWQEYGTLDWVLVRETMRGKTVLDGRNALDGVLLAELGFQYWSFGRATHSNGNGTSPNDDNAIGLPPFGRPTQINGNGTTPHEDPIGSPDGVWRAGVE